MCCLMQQGTLVYARNHQSPMNNNPPPNEKYSTHCEVVLAVAHYVNSSKETYCVERH